MNEFLPLGFRLADFSVTIALVVSHIHGFLFLRKITRLKASQVSRLTPYLIAAAAIPLALISPFMEFDGTGLEGLPWPLEVRIASAIWVFGSIGAYGLFLAWRIYGHVSGEVPLFAVSDVASARVPKEDGDFSRRRLLASAGQAALLAPFGMAGYGTVIGRQDFQLVETELKFPNLPADLDGIRLVQISDLHFGKYFTTPDLDRVIGMANETRAHLALVTGDLITGRGDPLEKCIDMLAGVRTDAGIRACMGNHEVYARSERFTAEYGRRKGVDFLRQQQEELRFGDARLNLCGVDYQRKNRPYLAGADALLRADAFNLLLSHNPDVLPVAAGMGYDLVIGGHTHGGQITIEIVDPWGNPGRFFTPFVSGKYQVDRTQLYVSRGVGTVTLPMRIGALPEVSLLTLRRA